MPRQYCHSSKTQVWSPYERGALCDCIDCLLVKLIVLCSPSNFLSQVNSTCLPRAVMSLAGQEGMDGHGKPPALSATNEMGCRAPNRQTPPAWQASLLLPRARFWATTNFLPSPALILAGKSHLLRGGSGECNKRNMGLGARETWVQI